MGLEYVDIFYPTARPTEAPLEETMGAWRTRFARARLSMSASHPTVPKLTREAARILRSERRSTVDSLAVLLDAEPLGGEGTCWTPWMS